MTIRLSICIATFSRAGFIGETLESIIGQLVEGVELVVLDGASPDNTQEVVAGFAARHRSVRYIRAETNSGIDADYDRAVGHARGEYCWLAADDDLIAPGAIADVLAALDDEPDLLVVDAEVRDVSMRHVLDVRRFGFEGERSYGPGDGDRLLADTGNALSFIGCTIIRRSVWLARDRERYYGSLFIHVGVIFQQPSIRRAKALGKSLVIIRLGNAMWTARSFEIWIFKWPELIWGFAGYGDDAKARVVPREPWRDAKKLFMFRANGAYSPVELRRFFSGRSVGPWRLVLWTVALCPGRLANVLSVIYLATRRIVHGSGGYNLLVCSRYANPVSRALVRLFTSPPGRDGGADPVPA